MVLKTHIKKLLSTDYQGLKWLPDLLISSSEWTDDYVSKFISIVRARDYFLPVTIAILVFHQ